MMFKKNKVQGKHAAPEQAEKGKKEGRKSADASASEGVRKGFKPKSVDADATVALPAPAPKIALPEVGPAATDGEKTVLMDPVAAEGDRAQSVAGSESAVPGGFSGAAPQWIPVKPEKNRKPVNKKKLAIAAGAVAGTLLLLYLVGVAVFSGRFYPNTVIGGQDVSMKTVEQAASMLDSAVDGYSVEVKGQGLDFTVASEDMEVKVDGEEVAREAHAKLPAWGWPVYLFTENDASDCLAAQHNESGLKKIVDDQVKAWNEEASAPADATIAYNAESKAFEVTPEEAGEQLDAEAVLEAVDKAVLEMASKAEIGPEQLLKPSVLKDDERLAKAAETANGYIGADLSLKMDGYDAGTIDGQQISNWVKLDDQLNVVFDEAAMDEWLTEFGNSLDTIGSERTYTRPDGKEVTVEGGTYGWEIDSAALVGTVREAIVNGTQGEIQVPVIAAGVYYNAEDGIDWADYLDIDLTEQHARLITEAGEVTWESDVVTGIPDGKHDTPTGAWTLFSRESPATLKGDIMPGTDKPEYETKVEFWMPFTYSGCGLHDATWQPAFGGELYKQGMGSHGCVNLPYDAAESLYSQVSVGLPVIVHW